MTFQGVTYRAHNPRWAFLPTSGEGAARFGGRFNPPGLPTLYTSLRVETAWLEAQQAFAFKAQPMTICAYDVDCADVLDLRDPAIAAEAGIQAGVLSCAWEDLASRKQPVPSWIMARGLIARGIAGIIVPSFAHRALPSDANAVFWRWGDAGRHRVRVVDDLGRLPQDDQSWR